MTTGGSLTFLHEFSGSDGSTPLGALVEAHGSLYGTTWVGGAFDRGTVFKISPDGSFVHLHSFDGGPGGGRPQAALIQSSDGNLYGTTSSGGTSLNDGTIFRMTPEGTVTTLYQLLGLGGAGGQRPLSPLIQATDGNFYGTAGIVFRLTPDGQFTVLYSPPGVGRLSRSSGALVEGRDGRLYGTAADGGDANQGTIFAVTPAGEGTVLYSFNGGNDAQHPVGALIQGDDGAFYGLTSRGGSLDRGTVFRMSAPGIVNVLHSFTGENIDGPAAPSGHLIQGSHRNFFGITRFGSAFDGGTVFEMTLDGVVTVLHHFGGFVSDDDGRGFAPSSLIQGNDGNLYGTTSRGGIFGRGTVFKLTVGGSFSIVHHFAATNEGAYPSSFIQGRDGNFYGTTDSGAIFRMRPDGGVTILRVSTGTYGTYDSLLPPGPLVQGNDGNFYGTTYEGDPLRGIFFRMTPAGSFTDLHVFNIWDLGFPGGLLEATDGNFYGTTDSVVFKLTPDGTVSILRRFVYLTDGSCKSGSLLQAADGNIYGMTSEWGPFVGGTIFRLRSIVGPTAHAMAIDTPLPGQQLTQPFVIAGWAIDQTAAFPETG
ncbi:MAG TPA: choice-of-anchor tandem repeat GloVer-containing protein, partial [Nitrospiraceae bacterium]